MRTSSEIKNEALASMNGKWGGLIAAVLIYAIILNVASFTYVGVILLTGPLSYGLYSIFDEHLKGTQFELKELFSGFNKFGDTFLLGLLTTIFVMLWSLLLIVPGIIAMIRYSQAYFIMKDNPGISAMDAIDRSSAMMDGHKMDFFVLNLSFIGWYLLSILTCGLGFILLAPYMYTSYAVFYQDLKAEQGLA